VVCVSGLCHGKYNLPYDYEVLTINKLLTVIGAQRLGIYAGVGLAVLLLIENILMP
jgi:flagellar biosynthesis/type III secretory pathway ATPase